MKNQIKSSDIKLALYLLGPNHYNLFIFDPNQRLVEDKPFGFAVVQDNFPNILVNLADEVTCYKSLQLNDFDFILDFGKSEIPTTFKSKQFNFMNNNDGSMRWLFTPGHIKSALSFYNASTLRAKFISFGLKVAEALKLDSLTRSGQFTLSYKSDFKLDTVFKLIPHDNFSIFTGTKGFNRTAVIAIENKKEVTHFAKIALNSNGAALLKNESLELNAFKNMDIDHVISPNVIDINDPNVLVMTNETKKGMKRAYTMQLQHDLALTEIFEQTVKITPLQNTIFWENILDNISALKVKSDNPNIERLKPLLSMLQAAINPKTNILNALSHSDFTPWNIKVDQNSLYVYDWELAQKDVPALYDLFHFHFQTGIILKKQSLTQILNSIEKALKMPHLKQIIETYEIDTKLYMQLYLLRTISYYLCTFQLQNILSTEQTAQLTMWARAVRAVMPVDNMIAHRQQFITEFYGELKRTPHALLKFEVGSFNYLSDSSDLDLAILKGDIPNIISFCKEHQLISKVTTVNKSFMSTISIHFKDYSFLSLDLIHQFKRKNIQMMDMSSLLVSARPNVFGIMVPAPRFDLEYAFLFYTLNQATIPQKYYNYFAQSNYGERESSFRYLNNKYNLNLTSFNQLFSKQSINNQLVKASIKSQPFQSVKRRITDNFNYILDTAKSILNHKGFIVTLSGVDGAGKSTIIKHVETQIKTQYRKEVVLLRHRPGILPILSSVVHGGKANAEKIAGETMPRTGNNHSLISSILRFGYYYMDYMIGQIYIYFKYILRGKVVLFDRYYFDFITDSERSNIRLNKRFIKLLYVFVIKPKLNILLWANPMDIYKRKQELQPKTIAELTKNYKKLFTSYNHTYKNDTYKSIENVKIDHTVSSIMKEFAKVV